MISRVIVSNHQLQGVIAAGSARVEKRERTGKMD